MHYGYIMFAEAQKQALVETGVIEPLLTLALSPDVRIQRNATGALLNLSYSGESTVILFVFLYTW